MDIQGTGGGQDERKDVERRNVAAIFPERLEGTEVCRHLLEWLEVETLPPGTYHLPRNPR